MKQRIITGTIFTIVLAAIVYFGEGKLEFLFSGVCVLLATMASYEFMRMLSKGRDFKITDILPVIFTFIFTLLSVIYFTNTNYFKYFFIFVIVILLIFTLIYISNSTFTKEEFGTHFLSIFYTSIGFIAFAYLRKDSLELIVYLFLVTMLTDVFAYFIGIKFGKHRLAVKISPKKSIEGAVGGLVLASALATVFAAIFNVFTYAWYYILILSALLSCISQIGDLIASKFKREAGIKDYSNILPGHGGILDRFDSSMFAAIFLMLFIIIF